MSESPEKPCGQHCDDCAYEVSDPETVGDLNDINQLIRGIQEIILENDYLCDLLFMGNTLDVFSLIPNSTECLRVNLSFISDPNRQVS